MPWWQVLVSGVVQAGVRVVLLGFRFLHSWVEPGVLPPDLERRNCCQRYFAAFFFFLYSTNQIMIYPSYCSVMVVLAGRGFLSDIHL